MVTLITQGDSDGITGRCDERCYMARHPECTCCCGGKNHGVGKEQAMENVRDWAEDILPAGITLLPHQPTLVE